MPSAEQGAVFGVLRETGGSVPPTDALASSPGVQVQVGSYLGTQSTNKISLEKWGPWCIDNSKKNKNKGWF